MFQCFLVSGQAVFVSHCFPFLSETLFPWNYLTLAILLVTFLERLSDLQLGDRKVTAWITWTSFFFAHIFWQGSCTKMALWPLPGHVLQNPTSRAKEKSVSSGNLGWVKGGWYEVRGRCPWMFMCGHFSPIFHVGKESIHGAYGLWFIFFEKHMGLICSKRWFKVTFLSPSRRSLNLWKSHVFTVPKRSQRLAMKNWMGPNPNGPGSVSYDRAIRYSGFFRVRETWVRPLEISWILPFTW